MAAFGSFSKTVNLATRIAIIIERHTNDYYVGWSAERLAEVVVEVRPTRPIHVDDATVISSNERLLNKKLAWAWVAETASARALRADVHAGRLTTMTAVKVAAAAVWKASSDAYDASRATHAPGTPFLLYSVLTVHIASHHRFTAIAFFTIAS